MHLVACLTAEKRRVDHTHGRHQGKSATKYVLLSSVFLVNYTRIYFTWPARAFIKIQEKFFPISAEWRNLPAKIMKCFAARFVVWKHQKLWYEHVTGLRASCDLRTGNSLASISLCIELHNSLKRKEMGPGKSCRQKLGMQPSARTRPIIALLKAG
jgi:hypothetical protein